MYSSSKWKINAYKIIFVYALLLERRAAALLSCRASTCRVPVQGMNSDSS